MDFVVFHLKHSSGGRHPRASKYRPGEEMFAQTLIQATFDCFTCTCSSYIWLFYKLAQATFDCFTNHLKVVGSDYVGSHWLASFLLHALEQRAET